MTYSVRNIVIALVLAAVAAFLVIMYTGNVQKQATDSQKSTSVLVAVKPIVAGTKVADAIAAHDFAVHQVVQRDVIAGAFGSTNQLNASLTVGSDITEGAQITGSMFRSGSSNPIAVSISGTTRAIQLAADKNSVLGGTLAAGDQIDLVGTYGNTFRDGGARIIARNVTVLSTSTSGVAQTNLQTTNDQPGVILAVPDDVVAKINYTTKFGELWFVLRPTHGASDGVSALADCKHVLVDGLQGKLASEAAKICAASAGGQ